MAVLDKATLQAAIDSTITTNGTGAITGAQLNGILDDMVDSYEDFMASYTTVQRNAISGGDLYQGLKIFNTTNKRIEYYSGTEWKPAGPVLPLIIDCSSNPNFPAALASDTYVVSVAGKIGGVSGLSVSEGDLIICKALTAAGDYGTVGTNWIISYSAGSAGQQVFMATLALSAAQLQAIKATPISIVSAPGAGKIILPISWVTSYTKVTTDYDAGGGPLVATFDTLTSAICALSPDLSAFTASGVVMGNDIYTAVGTAIANKALFVSSLLADLTTGDGTVTIQLYYKIHTL